MDEHYCDIEELFIELSERRTDQKHALVEKLLTPKRAWSAKQLWRTLGATWGDLSTAHRNLQHLKEKGFLEVATIDNGEAFYERPTDDHHDHLRCQKCDSLLCVPCPEPKPKLTKMRVTSHNTIFRGFCNYCT